MTKWCSTAIVCTIRHPSATAGNGAASCAAPRAHCDLCLHTEATSSGRVEVATPTSSARRIQSRRCLLPDQCACKTCGFARSNSCEAGQGLPTGTDDGPSRYKDWSPAAIFGGNSNDARVHPRGHLGGQSAPRSPGAQAAALASAWRGRGGDEATAS